MTCRTVEADRKEDTVSRKIKYVVGFIADYAYGALLLAAGLGLVVGGATGALWL